MQRPDEQFRKSSGWVTPVVRYTRRSMLRRLVTIAFAVLFAGAPVATELCNAACAANEDGHSAGDPVAHHSCHSVPAVAGDHTIAGVPHTCGHADSAPDGIDAGLQRLAAPAIVELVVIVERPLIRQPLQVRSPDYSPPPLSQPSQLRV